MSKRHLTYQKVRKLFGIKLNPSSTYLKLRKNGHLVEIFPVEMNQMTESGNFKKRFRVKVSSSH